MLVDFHSPNSNIKGTEIQKTLGWTQKTEILRLKDYRLRGINSKSATIREAFVNEKLLTIIIIKI